MMRTVPFEHFVQPHSASNPFARETIMVERSKKDESISPADKLVKTGKKGDIILTEKELAGVSGGKPTEPTVPTVQVSLAFTKIEFE